MKKKKLSKKPAAAKKSLASKSKKIVKAKAKPKSLNAPKPAKVPVQIVAKSVTPTKPTQETASPVQTRAPLRKIVGPGKTISIVPPANSSTQENQNEEKNVAVPVAQAKVVEERKVQLPPKTPWDQLPASVPAQFRYLLKGAMLECQSASESPFPFAKFIAALPTAVCGVGIALALSSRRVKAAEVAEIFGMSSEEVESLVRATFSDIEDQFTRNCGEMSRKWKAHLVGNAVTYDSIVERYLVPKLDRNFQLMIGELVLRSLGGYSAGHTSAA